MKAAAPDSRARDFDEVMQGYTKEESAAEASRCLNCHKPLCVEACPIHQNVPGYMVALAKGDFDGALRIIMERNPLPGVCGRVCPHPCVDACVLGKKGDPGAINWVKRAAADHGSGAGFRKEARAAGRVAIVGSGPAGLAAAWRLAREGFAPTVFEARDEPGGLLRYGIPSFRLPRKVLDSDIKRIVDLGVEMKTRSPVRTEEEVKSLLSGGYSAVLLTTGAPLPGNVTFRWEGVRQARHVLPFMEDINVRRAAETGGTVAVMGAGFSAMDAARSARRLGARSVIIYRREMASAPASKEEIEEAKEEGVEFMPLTDVKDLIVEGGVLKGLRLIRMQPGPPDESGRPRPVPMEGSDFDLPVDTLIMAVGQKPAAGEMPSLAKGKGGNIAVDRATGMTSMEGVFSAGDVVTGAWDIIHAIAGGVLAAEGVIKYLGDRAKQ